MAQLNGNGYYRGKNYETERYIYVTDDKGSVSAGSTNADVLALQLWKNFLKASSDPSTILYVEKKGSDYNIGGQGTSVYQMIQKYVSIMQSGTANGQPLYMVYGKDKGAVKYLGDAASVYGDRGEMSTNAQGENRKWYIIPVKADSDEGYFGVKPTVTAKGKYWHPMFTGFPYSAYSAGVKMYAVTKVDGDLAVIEEISGTVPSGTGVIVECANPLATDNRMNVGGTASPVSGNQLGGVYFDNSMKLHYNRTPYDKNTMRLLSSDANGNLVFVTGSIEFLPANESYLKVPAGSPATLKVVTKAEYEAEVAKRPTSVSITPATLSLLPGENDNLTATVLPAQAVTTLTWSSSNTGVATVDASGKVSAVAPGSATITVTTGNGLKSSANVTVKAVATGITLTPTTLELLPGETSKISATVTPGDAVDKSVRWGTSNHLVATVSEDGVVTALKPGSATITGITATGINATCQVTVKEVATGITISRKSVTLTEGEYTSLTATVTPSNAVDRTVTWTTSDASVATVDAEGNVTAIARGTAVVMATTVTGISDDCTVTVVPPLPAGITIEPMGLELIEGDQASFSVTITPANAGGYTLTWTSANPEVAQVDEEGNLTALAPGATVVTVRTSNNLTASASVVVARRIIPVSGISLNASDLSLIEGDEAILIATVTPADATDKSVVWSSSDPDVAAVSDGKVTALAAGEAVITATAQDFSASCTVNVAPKTIPVVYPTGVTLSETALDVEYSDTFTLTATVEPEDVTDNSVTWSVSDSNVLAPGDEPGEYKAVGGGTATVTVTTVNGLTASCVVNVYRKVEEIVINPGVIAAYIGSTATVTAEVLPADATDKTVTWSVADSSIAAITASDAAGCVITILEEGETELTAECADGVTGKCTISGFSGIDELLRDSQTTDVYNASGLLLRRGADADYIRSLAPGLYIIAGRKVLL